MANVLFVTAKKDFRDEEYFIPREILEAKGNLAKVASNGKAGGEAISADGEKVKIDVDLAEAKAENFDAIVFVGGPGALKNLDNKQSYSLIKSAFSENKLVAAICVAPSILAKAGILEGKKATVWSSDFDKSSIEILKDNGAEYVAQSVVEDGNLITANGPKAAEEFGEKIADYLSRAS